MGTWFMFGWEEPQKDSREKKGRRGERATGRLFGKEFVIFVSGWGLPCSFPCVSSHGKGKQVIISDEWVWILCSADQTLSAFSEVTAAVLYDSISFWGIKTHFTYHTQLCGAQICVNSHATKHWHRWKAEINGIITGFEENSSLSLK